MRTMKTVRCFVSVFMFCCALSIAQSPAAVQTTPDAIAFSHVSRGVDCHFVKEITALPEWQPFVDAFTKKIDAEYVKATKKPGFPQPLADMFLDKVRDATGKSDVSSRDVIELAIKNWEASIISLWLTGNDEKPAEAAFTCIIKFHPKELESFLSFVPGYIYDVVKNEEPEKIYRFRHDGKEVYLGYTKMENGLYIISVSEQLNRVEEVFAFAKSGKLAETALSQSGPIKRLTFPSKFFEKTRGFITEKAKEKAKDNPDAQNLAKILGNIDSFKYDVEDVDDATTMKVSLAMKDADEAKNVKDMAEGAIALLKFLANYNSDIDEFGKQAITLVTQIQIEQSDKTVTAFWKSNTPQLHRVLQMLMSKATEELKK